LQEGGLPNMQPPRWGLQTACPSSGPLAPNCPMSGPTRSRMLPPRTKAGREAAQRNLAPSVATVLNAVVDRDSHIMRSGPKSRGSRCGYDWARKADRPIHMDSAATGAVIACYGSLAGSLAGIAQEPDTIIDCDTAEAVARRPRSARRRPLRRRQWPRGRSTAARRPPMC